MSMNKCNVSQLSKNIYLTTMKLKYYIVILLGVHG